MKGKCPYTGDRVTMPINISAQLYGVTIGPLGLDVLGIFRRTPSNALVHQIKARFDRGENVRSKMIAVSHQPLY